MVSFAMRGPAQNLPKADHVRVTKHNAQPYVHRMRMTYEDGIIRVLSSACPRPRPHPDGHRLQFRDERARVVSVLYIVPEVDLLVLDKPIHLPASTGLRRVSLKHDYAAAATATAPERPELGTVAIKLDDPRISIDMLVSLFTNINAKPPQHIIFLCDDEQLWGLVADVQPNRWGLQAIDDNSMAFYNQSLLMKATRMMNELWDLPEVPEDIKHSFALDCKRYGLAPGE